MKCRILLMVSCLWIAVGLAMYLANGRVFTTYLLDIVVGTISPDSTEEIPAYEFSWGVKEWGNMATELSRSGWALALIAAGQAILVPLLVPRSAGVAKLGVIVGFASLIASGLLAVGASFGVMQAFGSLAVSGAADPVHFGEMLPVGPSDLSRWLLVVGEGLLVVVGGVAAIRGGTWLGECSKARRITSWVSVLLLGGFVAALLSVRFGPLTDVLTRSGPLDPVELASQITTAVHAALAAGVLLMLSGVLGVVSGSLPARRFPASGESERD